MVAGDANDVTQSVSVQATGLGDYDLVRLVDLQFIKEVRCWLFFMSVFQNDGIHILLIYTHS